MSISSPTVLEAIRSAKEGEWNIPGFQRGFVWQRPKILLLLDSLFNGYPIGTVLNWKVPETEGQVAGRSSVLAGATTWVIDGQQRVTALCMLTNQKPYWWQNNDDWNRRVQGLKPMIRLRPDADVEFQLENPIRRRNPEWFRVDPFLAELARIKYEHFDDALDERASESASSIVKTLESTRDLAKHDVDQYIAARDEIKTRLTRLGRLLLRNLPCQSIDLDPVSVAEVFERVNRAGTRVRETDVTVAWVEAHNPGWVRSSFLPFCQELDEAGWSLPSSLLIPVLVAACGLNPNLRNIPADVWKDSSRLDDGWRRVRKAIESVRQSFQALGIPLPLVPSKNAMFPCLLSAARGMRLNKQLVARMFLAATAAGRYSASSGTKFREDSLLIESTNSFDEAVSKYVGTLTPRHSPSDIDGASGGPWAIAVSDLKAPYSSAGTRYLRLLYFMTVFPTNPRAWFGSNRDLAFTRAEGSTLDPDLKPEWHHFFPRAHMKAKGIEDERVNWFGNIVVLDAKANRTINAKAPLEYLQLEQVHAPPDELAKQFVPAASDLHVHDRFQDFLDARHARLAGAMNERLRDFGLVR